MLNSKKNWWMNSVIYQIYPRSFQDSNGDGIGDLRGIISRLDYLKKLGIDAIWLSPVYSSPQDDNGYDISDYRGIDPVFGTLKDMEELISSAKALGIRIIMDLVLNHTSDEHQWFIEARKSLFNPWHDYYVWRDGKEGSPPNSMKAAFGGSAWEWVPEIGQYYFHQFSLKQPDLNWNNPQLRRELYDMILWWMDKGVGGFRLDVIDQIAKEPDQMITMNGSKLHSFIREMSEETFQKGDLVTVGEAWGANVENAKLYSNPDGSELSMVFQFEHCTLDQKVDGKKWDLAPLDFMALKRIFSKWQIALHETGWNSLFWNNHDLPRIVSRWGNDGVYRIHSAKMLATLLHGLQGTPYIYQGEELGMTNVKFSSISSYRDIETVNMFKERKEKGFSEDDIMKSIHAKSRDNGRTPMQWDKGQYAGFTTGTPWIPVNPNYEKINAALQTRDPDSIFNYYKKLISLRKEYDIFVEGAYSLLMPEDPQVFAYERKCLGKKLTVICNFFENEAYIENSADISDMALLLCNYGEAEPLKKLRPYEARMYYTDRDSHAL
ncbi:MAG: alpha-glucosidase [Clostridiales bacterium]|jgi:glucan 1,6-alpha-glucosidase|nr:alpha-glucosidase [Clostridiales bacterium]